MALQVRIECALVDHTGIDIIANNPHTAEVMGISVKSRSRAERTETEYVYVANSTFEKVKAACEAFGCVPYFSIVVDAGETIRRYVVTMEHLLEISPRGKVFLMWKMREADLVRYEQDPEIKSFLFRTEIRSWW